ncbi:hypothetical protein R3P38DRAFT_3242555 [Favolaschia claudopus]|uniref:Transposase n=1 Tax=Favolaschia claudopus TaxID=2862362 RepID=A0AAV9Z403_9AGAR
MSAHMSVPDIAAATDISERTIYRIIRTWRTTGDHVRIPLQLGRPRILTSFDVAYLEGLVARTHDIYLFELQECLYEATGLDVAKTTIRDALLRMGYVRVHISRTALEAEENKRLGFQCEVGQHPPRRLVFLDEAACNRHTTRRQMAWAPIGMRARRHDFFVRGIRYVFLLLPALRAC